MGEVEFDLRGIKISKWTSWELGDYNVFINSIWDSTGIPKYSKLNWKINPILRLNYGRGITTYSKNIDEWLDSYVSFHVLQYDILS